jgi:hypothetical protein
MKMVYFDVTTLTEVQYACFDYTSISAFVDTLTLPVPSWLVKIGLQVLRAGHFDLTLVFSDAATFTQTQIDTITTGITAKFPKFTWAKLY